MFDVTNHPILARQTTQASDRIVDHNEGGSRTLTAASYRYAM